MTASGSALSRAEAVALVGLAVGAGAVADGGLLAVCGASDLAPGLAPGVGTWAVAAVGAVAVLGAGLVLRRRLAAAVSAVVPPLYPYAGAAANAGVYLAILVSAVAVYAGFFEMFVGAHDNGDFGSVGNQTALSALIDVATILLWVVMGYAVLLIHRMVSIGRFLEAPGGPTDAYGGPVEPTSLPAPPRPGWVVPPAGDLRARATLLALSVGVAFTTAAGIQVAEVGLAPASAGDWWAGQVLLPAMPIAVVFGTEAIGRGVREIERRFSARWPAVPSGATVTSPPL